MICGLPKGTQMSAAWIYMLVPRPGPKYLALRSALAAGTPTWMRIPSDDEVVPSPQADESGAASTKLSRFASAASKVSSRICQSMDQESWRVEADDHSPSHQVTVTWPPGGTHASRKNESHILSVTRPDAH